MASGAGLWPAGNGPAGFSPVEPGSPRRPWTPAAMRYEGSVRDWVLDAAGNYRSVHPIDQMVAIGMCTRKGALKSCPQVGNTIFEIKYLGGADLQADIEDRIRTAVPIAALLADKSITIIRVEHSTSSSGGLAVVLHYTNNKLDRNHVNSAAVAT